MAALMVGWSALLRHNLARGERVIAENPGRANYLVLSADFLEYRDYFARFPTRLGDLHGPSLDVEFYKRPLYGPISGFLSVAVHGITGLTYPANMQVILSFYASLSVMLLVGIARRLGLPWLDAALVGGLGTLSFSWLSIFSVPESYSLSVCAALLVLHSGMNLARRRVTHVTAPMLRHTLAAGIAGWVYLPLCGAVLMVRDGVEGRRQWLTIVLPCVALAVVVAFAPHLYRGRDALLMQYDYGSGLTGANNFTHAVLMGRIAAGFFWFGIIAPVRDFVMAAPSVELSAAWRSWPVILAVLIASLAYVGLAVSLKRSNYSHSRGAIVWLGSLLLFHVFFNPGEVLLHVAVPVAVLLFVAAAGVAAREQSAGKRWHVRACLMIVVGLLAAINLPAAIGA